MRQALEIKRQRGEKQAAVRLRSISERTFIYRTPLSPGHPTVGSSGACSSFIGDMDPGPPTPDPCERGVRM